MEKGPKVTVFPLSIASFSKITGRSAVAFSWHAEGPSFNSQHAQLKGLLGGSRWCERQPEMWQPVRLLNLWSDGWRQFHVFFTFLIIVVPALIRTENHLEIQQLLFSEPSHWKPGRLTTTYNTCKKCLNSLSLVHCNQWWCFQTQDFFLQVSNFPLLLRPCAVPRCEFTPLPASLEGYKIYFSRALVCWCASTHLPLPLSLPFRPF